MDLLFLSNMLDFIGPNAAVQIVKLLKQWRKASTAVITIPVYERHPHLRHMLPLPLPMACAALRLSRTPAGPWPGPAVEGHDAAHLPAEAQDVFLHQQKP